MIREFAIIFCFTWLTTTGVAKPGNGVKNSSQTALQTITTRLETLSRITNGIALQKELNFNSLKIDHLLAEILGMDPKRNGLEDLRKFDIDGLSKRYASISKEAAAIEKSSIDESKAQFLLNALEKMRKNLDAIKRAENQDFSEIQQKSKKFYDYDVFSVYFILLNEYINSTFQARENFNNDKQQRYALRKLKESLSSLPFQRDVFMQTESSYKDGFEKIWGIIGISDQLTALEAISDTAETYQNTFSEISTLSKSMSEIRTEFAGLSSFVEKNPEMSSLKESLVLLHEQFQELSSSQVSIKKLTAGFPKGISDMNLVSKDLDNQWFVNTVAKGNTVCWKSWYLI